MLLAFTVTVTVPDTVNPFKRKTFGTLTMISNFKYVQLIPLKGRNGIFGPTSVICVCAKDCPNQATFMIIFLFEFN